MSRVSRKEDEFFDMFKDYSLLIVETGRLYAEYVHNYPKPEDQISKMKDCETNGDHMVRRILETLDTSFITPFDREDINALAKSMDDIVDNIEGVSARFGLYGVEEMRPEAIEMCDLTVSAIEALNKAFGLFSNYKKDSEAVVSLLREVGSFEDNGDVVYRNALGTIFRNDLDARETLKWKSLLDKMEDALDSCKGVATIMRNVIMKNA
jgi:predicted phosphate transport protein (TIGR00153 family)